ncbi:uncharacterized protein LOC142356690 [Convolutriloba macropyga]|uniref:uncharacterized protein LOC142356690 n=1 Tax=Convolutriloba macropyga TaxID=536237 RepID=UPI003F5275DB
MKKPKSPKQKKKKRQKPEPQIVEKIFETAKTAQKNEDGKSRQENRVLKKVHSSNHKLSRKIEKQAKKLKKKKEKQKIIEASDVSSISTESEFFNSASDFFSDCENNDVDKHKSDFEKLQKMKKFVKNCSSSEEERNSNGMFDTGKGKYSKTTYTRVSRTSFVDRYFPKSSNSVMSEHSKHSKKKNKDRSDSKKSKRKRNRSHSRSLSLEELSGDDIVDKSKTSGDYFFGRGGKSEIRRETSLQRRIENNRESSRRLAKNSASSNQDYRKLEHNSKRYGTKRHSRSRSPSKKRKRKSSRRDSSSEISQAEEKSKKKIQAREFPRTKKRRRKERSSDNESKFKSTTIKLDVSEDVRVPTGESEVTKSVKNEAEIVIKTEDEGSADNTELARSADDEIAFEMPENEKSNATCTETSSIEDEKHDIEKIFIKQEPEVLGEESSQTALRERLKTLLEKKDFTPVLPDVPLRSLKIEVNADNSAVLSSVPADTKCERKLLPISVKSQPKIEIKKNLALSKFLVHCQKDVIGPRKAKFPEKAIQKESKDDVEASSSEESENESSVYQGCANKPTVEFVPETNHTASFGVSHILKSIQASDFSPSETTRSENTESNVLLSNNSVDKSVTEHCDGGSDKVVDMEFDLEQKQVNSNNSSLKSNGAGAILQGASEGIEKVDGNSPVSTPNFEQVDETVCEQVETNDENCSTEENLDDSDVKYFCPQAQEFLKANISEDVVLELDQLYADGLLSENIADDVIKSLSEIGEELGLFVIQQFRESDLSKIRSRTLFFKGKVRLAAMKGKALLKDAAVKKPQSAEQIALEKYQKQKEANEAEEMRKAENLNEARKAEEEIKAVEVADIESLNQDNPSESQLMKPRHVEEQTYTSNSIRAASSCEDFSLDRSSVDASFSTPSVIKMTQEKITKIDISSYISNAEPRQEGSADFDYADDRFERSAVNVKLEMKKEKEEPKPQKPELKPLASQLPVVQKPALPQVTQSQVPYKPPIPIKLRSKPELTAKRGGKQAQNGSGNNDASVFNNEVATLNQILVCGAGPSNYVPHQEGQYTPTKMEPNYEKLSYLVQITNYNYDDSDPCNRCFGPPNDYHLGKPGPDCKLFVGKLPCDVFEDDLIPVFFEAGNIYELRVLLDPNTGLNKGFCFVTMCTKIETERALRLLHGRFIKPRHKMIVKREVGFNQLFVCNLPTNKTEREILSAFSSSHYGIVDCDMVYKKNEKVQGNSGFCILTFESFQSAKKCRDLIRIQPKAIEAWNGYKDYCVDWAIPNDVLHDKKPEGSSTIVVKNLKLNTSEAELLEHFRGYGSVEKVRVREHVAFIVYQSCKEALDAKRASIEDGLTVEMVDNDPDEADKLMRNRLLEASTEHLDFTPGMVTQRNTQPMMQRMPVSGLVPEQMNVPPFPRPTSLNRPLLATPSVASANQLRSVIPHNEFGLLPGTVAPSQMSGSMNVNRQPTGNVQISSSQSYQIPSQLQQMQQRNQFSTVPQQQLMSTPALLPRSLNSTFPARVPAIRPDLLLSQQNPIVQMRIAQQQQVRHPTAAQILPRGLRMINRF